MFTTSISLLQRLRGPQARPAWDKFVQLYTPLLYFWVRRLDLSEEDAADLVQDVLATLVEKLPEFEYNSKKSFRAWLRAVTMNRWRNNQRRRVAASLGSNADQLADDAAEPIDELGEAEYRQYLVGRALRLMQDEFEPTTWQMFWQHMVQGRSPAEVAEQLGVRPGSVYTAKSRILRRLREELDGLLD